MLTKRQRVLLQAIIKEHTKTVEPVGSEGLVSIYKLKISPATARNEMLELDRLGFLKQPHASSGRIPTEAAYRYFYAASFQPAVLPEEVKHSLNAAFSRNAKNDRGKFKELAKSLSEASKEFILAAFSDNDFYYTGLTHLFSHPEFRGPTIVCNVSIVIDHLDSRLSRLFRISPEPTNVLIGKDNPIDTQMTLMTVRMPQGPLLGLLGPMRMKYRTNFALLEYAREELVSR